MALTGVDGVQLPLGVGVCEGDGVGMRVTKVGVSESVEVRLETGVGC